MDDDTKRIIENVAAQAAEEAVKKMLTTLGINHANPLETQRDMAALREWRDLISDQDFQADMMHLRSWRTAMDGVKNKSMLALIGILVTGAATAMWVGLKAAMGMSN